VQPEPPNQRTSAGEPFRRLSWLSRRRAVVGAHGRAGHRSIRFRESTFEGSATTATKETLHASLVRVARGPSTERSNPDQARRRQRPDLACKAALPRRARHRPPYLPGRPLHGTPLRHSSGRSSRMRCGIGWRGRTRLRSGTRSRPRGWAAGSGTPTSRSARSRSARPVCRHAEGLDDGPAEGRGPVRGRIVPRRGVSGSGQGPIRRRRTAGEEDARDSQSLTPRMNQAPATDKTSSGPRSGNPVEGVGPRCFLWSIAVTAPNI
jgi:hypothetical protein